MSSQILINSRLVVLSNRRQGLRQHTNCNGRVRQNGIWMAPAQNHPVHCILARKHPQDRIFIAKYDYSDAYRRIAHSASAAIQSIALFAGLAFIGGSPNPPTWCMFSETVTNLANKLLLCDDWDESELHNPDQAETPTPILRYDPPHLALTRETVFEVPLSSTARVNGFIDDLIVVFRDTIQNQAKAPTRFPWQCMLPVDLMPERRKSLSSGGTSFHFRNSSLKELPMSNRSFWDGSLTLTCCWFSSQKKNSRLGLTT
jgi:hypothetical protein